MMSVKQINNSMQIPLDADHVDRYICSHTHTHVAHAHTLHIFNGLARCCDSLVAELCFCLQPGGGTQTNIFVYQIYAGLKLILPIALLLC